MKNFIFDVISAYKKKEKVEEKKTSKFVQDLKYKPCPQHPEELLSLVCLEPQCKSKILCCCLCESHKNHNVKSLKLLICEYETNIKEKKSNSPRAIDKKLLSQKLDDEEGRANELINKVVNTFSEKMQSLQKELERFYDTTRKQVKAPSKNVDEQIFIEQVIKSDDLQTALVNLIDNVTITEPVADISANPDLAKLIELKLKDTNVLIQEVVKNINGSCDQLLNYVVRLNQAKLIAPRLEFQFDKAWMHPQLEYISPTHVKSSGSSQGYKFAVMDAAVTSSMTFQFKMLQLHASNWIAVGLCNAQVIKDKNFSFAFQNPGHGAYLISSNGGSWSTSTASQNNVVKAFKFTKGDIVKCEYDFITRILKFHKVNVSALQKQKADQHYELQIDKSEPALHPCVLFYYTNDEVQFMKA